VHIICDKYELLELFQCEPNVIDEDAEIYVYTSINKNGFKFELYLSIYDMNASITLYHNELTVPIFDIGVSDVRKIEAFANKLSIYSSEDDNPIAVIFFESNFRLELNSLNH